MIDSVREHTRKASINFKTNTSAHTEKGIGHALIAIALAIEALAEAVQQKK